MRRQFVILFALAGLLFAAVAAGASMLVLDGSNSAPGSGKTEAACAGPLIVTHPVERAGHDNNRITYVRIEGDMTACAGQTMLVEVDLTGLAHAYAVHVFDGTETDLSLVFDATTGDFYDTDPDSLAGSLVPAGSRLDPIKVKDFGLVTLTIAAEWA